MIYRTLNPCEYTETFSKVTVRATGYSNKPTIAYMVISRNGEFVISDAKNVCDGAFVLTMDAILSLGKDDKIDVDVYRITKKGKRKPVEIRDITISINPVQ